MEHFFHLVGLLVLSGFLQSCSVPPAPEDVAPSRATQQIVAERMSAVIVSDRENLDSWVKGRFATSLAPKDADGGSAVPISPDGYFLTADHVLARAKGRTVFVLCGQGKRLSPVKARVVWRSASSDLALLHIPCKTPYFYEWTPAARWLPAGSRLLHGGMSTGFRVVDGKLRTPLAPERVFTATRPFKIDIPLEPGDSGGPVVDAYGRLVGINSAVEFLVPMETQFFIDSEGRRPNTRFISALIRNDRARHSP